MLFCSIPKNARICVLPLATALVSIGGFLASSNSVQADTPAQVQKAIQAACDRATFSYQQRNLAGYNAMFAPEFSAAAVTGRRTNFLQNQANAADAFANNKQTITARCTVSQVVLQGNKAKAILQWHYVSHHFRSASTPAYTITRDYQEQALWKKSSSGWQEVIGQMTHDVIDYQR